jgi:FKBP-type peptidyl-prolyl cis-trans isomerase SlyD
MTEAMIVADNTVVQLAYTLTNDEGEVLDTATHDEGFAYLHGADNIVPGLERELAGAAVGDKLRVTVAPDDAYGPLGPEGERHTIEVPRDQFPPDAPLEVGHVFTAFDDDDRPFPIWIVSADDAIVVITPQHPLAGETLHFDVEVLSIRPATDSEIEHGHAHGPGGHHHH